MQTPRIVSTAVVAWAVVCSATQDSDADTDQPSAVAADVRQILEVGWKPSQDNYAAAKTHYEAALSAGPSDVRVPYAMALVAVQNHHPAEAAQHLDEATSNGKPLLPIRRAKTWLAALRKDKEATKTGIRELAAQLGQGDAQRADFQETANWLGKLLGYYHGAGIGQLPEADVAALEGEISDKLKGPLMDEWTKGKGQVADQYAQLQAQIAQAHQDALARNQTKLAAARQQNEAALNDTSASRKSAESRQESFEENYKHDAGLKRSELNDKQRQYNTLSDQQTQLQNAIDAENQKKSGDQNSQLISQWQRQLRNTNDSMSQLNRDARNIQAWFNQMDAEENRISREIQRLTKLEEGLTRKSKDLEKPATDSDGSTAALEGNAKLVSTYAGIDLDEEKERILSTYRQPAK